MQKHPQTVPASHPRLWVGEEGALRLEQDNPQSIGAVKAFYGNFLVVVRALTYLMTLGKEGVPEASSNAVLNCNYMMNHLRGCL